MSGCRLTASATRRPMTPYPTMAMRALPFITCYPLHNSPRTPPQLSNLQGDIRLMPRAVAVRNAHLTQPNRINRIEHRRGFLADIHHQAYGPSTDQDRFFPHKHFGPVTARTAAVGEKTPGCRRLWRIPSAAAPITTRGACDSASITSADTAADPGPVSRCAGANVSRGARHPVDSEARHTLPNASVICRVMSASSAVVPRHRHCLRIARWRGRRGQ